MKWIIILILVLIFCLCACSPSGVGFGSANSNPSSNISTKPEPSQSSSTSLPQLEFTPYELKDYTPEEWENRSYPQPKSWEDIAIFEYPPKRVVDTVKEDVIHVEGMYADILPVITNERPLEEIMSPMYPGSVCELFENGDSRGGMPYDIAVYKDVFPISFLRKTGAGQYYTVNKVYDGGYAYIFFERPRDYAADDKRYITEDETKIVMTGCIYSEKLMYKADFDGLQVGDTMEDVLKIDHATILSKQFCEWYEDIYGMKKEKYMTKHLLRDGVLVITYTGETSNDDYTITAIEYFSDSIFLANAYFDPIYQGYPKNYTILPQDYPPA